MQSARDTFARSAGREQPGVSRILDSLSARGLRLEGQKKRNPETRKYVIIAKGFEYSTVTTL